jgi:hypothetical protein
MSARARASAGRDAVYRTSYSQSSRSSAYGSVGQALKFTAALTFSSSTHPRTPIQLPSRLLKYPTVGLTYVALGLPDLAIDWFDRASQERCARFSFMANGDPRLEGLRSDPRFETLLSRMRTASTRFAPNAPGSLHDLHTDYSPVRIPMCRERPQQSRGRRPELSVSKQVTHDNITSG